MTILAPNSPLLAAEIDKYINNNKDNEIIFHNTSMIQVVTANDNARSKRANILIVDEFRMVPFTILNTVLRKFLTAERHPKYLDKPQYKHMTERNKEMYLSSAYFKKHWSWEKFKTYCAALFDETRQYFVCGLPYQLSIKEGLLNEDQVADEMAEDDFSSISFDIEMGCMFYGESEDALFRYDDLVNARTVKQAFYPCSVTNYFPALKNPIKKSGEVRLIVSDIAVMGSKKRRNDATAIHVMQLIPTNNGQYIRNIVYSENYEGGHSETQALTIRRLYEDFMCDYIVIDTQGVGNGVFDELVRDLNDPETGDIYPAFTCMNDDTMAAKYKGASKNPPKVIYSIKANQKFNSDCAYLLKDNLIRGKTRLLIDERMSDEAFKSIKGFNNLDADLKAKILMPYIQTTLLINELVNLQYEINGANIKISEKANARKDRYSALAYGNYFATELERNITKKRLNRKTDEILFEFKAPNIRK